MSGYSMDDVRVHYNSPKPAQLQALAYAQGTDIHVASGQESHLPHEVWHVVQQKQGRVAPTTQMQGINVNDNEGLEKEADTMGGKAIQYKKDNSKPLVQKSLNSNTSQLAKTKYTTIKYDDQEGKSSKSNKYLFIYWPTINKVFEQEVKVGTEIKTNEDGSVRERYQCAEPHAFAKYLQNKNFVTKSDLKSIEFEEATYHNTEKKVEHPIETCDVCSQWMLQSSPINDDIVDKFFGNEDEKEYLYRGENEAITEEEKNKREERAMKREGQAKEAYKLFVKKILEFSHTLSENDLRKISNISKDKFKKFNKANKDDKIINEIISEESFIGCIFYGILDFSDIDLKKRLDDLTTLKNVVTNYIDKIIISRCKTR